MMGRKGRESKHRRAGAGQGQAASEAFLAKNGLRPEVLELDSGLQLEVISEGDGETPTLASTVRVDQRVRLIDGKIIGDTFKDGRPDTFSLTEAVEGYAEGLCSMRVGGRTIIYCPPELAWGRKGAGKKIPPNALVIYDVRLRAITLKNAVAPY